MTTTSREGCSTSRAATWTASLSDIASIVLQRKSERPGNAWHPKHSTYGLMQSAAMPALAARQGKRCKDKQPLPE